MSIRRSKMCSKLCPRTAVTLLELLVVIAIITLLITLFFPAVQSARDSARRTTCADHLKQIGLAFQLHHDAFKAFPSGGSNVDTPRSRLADGHFARGSDQEWGWAYQVLPYLEQQALWENTDDDAVRRTTIDGYFCPSRRAPIAFDVATGKSVGFRAQIDYAGCGGTEQDGKDGLLVRSKYTNSLNEVVKLPPVRLAGSVPDGASNTLLVGERYINPTWVDMPTGPEDDEYRGGFITGLPGKLRFLVRSGSFQPAKDRTYETPDDYSRFGSAHPKAFNAVFADGALHVIRYDVSLKVLEAAARRDDGAVFNVSDL